MNSGSRFRILKARTTGKLRHGREERAQKKNTAYSIIFLCVLVFFLLSLAVYTFQDLIPRFSVDTQDIVSPNSTVSKDADFKSALQKFRVPFESLRYATESPTLVVQLSPDTYAYLNTSLSAFSQVKLLANILSRLSIQEKEKKFKYIDLRFEKAIVRY